MIQIDMQMPEKCGDCIFCDDNCSCVASDYNGAGINVGCAFRTGRRDIRCPLKEQEKPNGKCVNECECWDSAYERGKQDTLKEQEAVKPVLDEQTGRIWLCGKCGTYVGFEDNDPHDPNEFDKYCRECGTPVLWEGRS